MTLWLPVVTSVDEKWCGREVDDIIECEQEADDIIHHPQLPPAPTQDDGTQLLHNT